MTTIRCTVCKRTVSYHVIGKPLDKPATMCVQCEMKTSKERKAAKRISELEKEAAFGQRVAEIMRRHGCDDPPMQTVDQLLDQSVELRTAASDLGIDLEKP